MKEWHRKNARERKSISWLKLWQSEYAVQMQIFLFLLVSLGQFIAVELCFGMTLADFTATIIMKNLALIAACNLVLVCLFHQMRRAFLVSTVFFLLVAAANYFVVQFRGYGIVFMDFFAVFSAAKVAGNYDYRIGKELAQALAVGGLCLLFCLCMPSAKTRYFEKKVLLWSGAGLASAVLFFVWINVGGVFFSEVSALTWDHSIGIHDYGYVLYFVANAGEAKVSRPSGYSAGKAENILAGYEQTDREKVCGGAVESPNIIVIMNESFSDLRVLGEFETNRNPLSFYDSLEENTIKGYAQTSVYGGYTANSEFEFLTGCTKAFLPGNPYLQYMKEPIPSLISNIKENNERYEEAVAIHPYHASGYNRNRVYPLLGFDRFLSLDAFSDSGLVREYVSDLADYRKIEELYEQKKPGTSLLVFNVTMQNHNPYTDESYMFEEPVNITSFAASKQVNQYLSLMKCSDNALKELITYFEKVEEPTIILLFGDHQPHLPDSFYLRLFDKAPSQFSEEETMKKHLVPYLFWANYDLPKEEGKCTSLNYLGPKLKQLAGLALSDYDRYLLSLSEKLPVITAAGCYNAAGCLATVKEMQGEDKALLQEYEIVQYQYLFDTKTRNDSHY